jgi:hypothetical protein
MRRARRGAGPDSEIDATGDHGLQRLTAPTGIKQFEIEAVLLKYPRPPADIGNATVPIVRRPDGELECILALTDGGIRYGRSYRHQAESCEQSKHRMSFSGSSTVGERILFVRIRAKCKMEA